MLVEFPPFSFPVSAVGRCGPPSERPVVAVWTTGRIATFLTFIARDRLAVMWWLIALRGLRRGETTGLRWVDVDLDAGVLMVEQQRIANGHLVTVGRRRPPRAGGWSR